MGAWHSVVTLDTIIDCLDNSRLCWRGQVQPRQRARGQGQELQRQELQQRLLQSQHRSVEDDDDEGYDSDGHDNDDDMSGLDSITKRTCADQGYWLGNTTGQLFTVIDTPGFGKNI